MWFLMNDRTGVIRNIWGICTYMQVLKKTKKTTPSCEGVETGWFFDAQNRKRVQS